MEIKWIKLSTDLFNNRKIRQIESLPEGDALVVIWLKLLILASDVNDGGLVYFTKDIPYTDQILATQFGRPLSTVQLALKVFEEFGMIDIENELIRISNWEKYQNVEGMEKIREQNRLRKQAQRERERLALIGDVTGLSRDVTQENKNKNKKENKNNVEGKSKRFIPPTISEVITYCNENGYPVDAARFVDFYESKGWMVGKNKMKDWKAAVRGWANRDKKETVSEDNSWIAAAVNKRKAKGDL